MRRQAVVLGLSFLVLGCDGSPTIPRSAEAPAAALQRHAVPPGRRTFHGDSMTVTCRTALAGADPARPWQHGTATVRFPAAELAPDGRTVRYIYRGYRDASTLAAVADCRIPATPGAVARMDRKLHVRARSGTDDVRLFSDVALAPVVAVACSPGYIGDYPACYQITTPTSGGTTDPGADGGFWSGGGGGEDGSGGSEDDGDEIESDEPPDCTQPQTERWALAYCRAARPDGTRLEWTKAALDRVSKRGEECARIAAFGTQMLASGSIQYFEWQEADGLNGGWGSPDIGVLLADFWVDDFGDPAGRSTSSFDNKLVHEIEHAMGRPHVEHNQTPNSLACDGL